MEKIKQIKFKYLMTLIVFLVISFSFYWYDIRPKNIKALCSNDTIEKLKEKNQATIENYNVLYTICTRKYKL